MWERGPSVQKGNTKGKGQGNGKGEKRRKRRGKEKKRNPLYQYFFFSHLQSRLAHSILVAALPDQ